MRVRLEVAYLGGPFAGWQRQPRRRTVQGELELALARLTGGLELTLVGAGRTDAGVHAAAQAAHVDLPFVISGRDLVRGLNGHLPDSIRVRAASRVGPSFDARRSACAKLYVYRARWGPPPLPWGGLRWATLRPPVDRAAMAEAVALLPGRRDMASFSVPDPETATTTRTLLRAGLVWRPRGVVLSFLGDAFLRYQVRRMVGAALEVGWRRRSLDAFAALLERPTPGARLLTAPARGLTLERVYYRPPAGGRG